MGLGDTEGMTEEREKEAVNWVPRIRDKFRRKTETFPDMVTI